MKNVTFNLFPLRLAFVGILFAALSIFGPSEVKAQSSTIAPNFVAPHVAIERMSLEANDLKALLEVLTPNTSSYNNAIWKYELVSVILTQLEAGMTVSESYVNGIALYSTDPYENMPSSQKKANKVAIYELLLQ